MSLTGDMEYALEVPEDGTTVNWSALNLIVANLRNRGFRSPVDLEDAHGNIRETIDPESLEELTVHLVDHSEVIAHETSEPPWRERVKTFADTRETVIFLRSALGVFAESIREKRSLVVKKMLASKIHISPGSVEEVQ